MSERPKVQHSKCCVVSQPPWVQIPALPPLPPGPNGAGRFCCAWMVCGRVCWGRAAWCALLGRAAWCARGRRATWLMVLLVVPLVFRVPSGPAAREIATREPTARSGRSRSPPVPSGPSGTLHTGGACVAVCGWARRLEARPGPAAAHGHRRPRVPQPGPAGLAVPSMLVVQTPFGGGEITVRGGVMPKVQTTSAKNAENGLLWAKWSAFWAHRYLS